MNLVLIEWLKLKGLRTFKVILLLYAVLLPLFFYSLSEISIFKYFYSDSIYTFPKVYHYVTYLSSFFNLMLGVIIVLFTCNEIKYKTQRHLPLEGARPGLGGDRVCRLLPGGARPRRRGSCGDVRGREKEVGGSGGPLNPLGLFLAAL